jgi:hypothetical protein
MATSPSDQKKKKATVVKKPKMQTLHPKSFSKYKKRKKKKRKQSHKLMIEKEIK